jgi:hypothetical protein
LTQEAAAPMSIITVAAVNTTTNPLWNGPEINWGKNCLPVSTARVDSGLLQDSTGAQQFEAEGV